MVTDVDVKNWLALVEEAVSTLSTLDSLYYCATGETQFVVTSTSCVSSVESLKSTFSQLTTLSNWENSASRS